MTNKLYAYLLLLVAFLVSTVRCHYNSDTVQCFQCEYRPPKIHTVHFPVQEEFEYRVPVVKQECPQESARNSQYNQYGYRYGQFGLSSPYGYPTGSSSGYRGYQKPACTPKVEYEIRKGYRLKYERRAHSSPAGGYNPCVGPLDHATARATGVDDRPCSSACYTRTDSYGNVARGCYRGEYGLDPKHAGPQASNGQTYRFCQVDHCNGDQLS